MGHPMFSGAGSEAQMERPVQQDFAALAADHRMKSLFVVLIAEAMGDDRGDVDACGDEDGHFVPGLVHFAAVDAADGQHVEDDFAPVGCIGLEGMPSMAMRPPWHMLSIISLKATGESGHFEADIEAFLHAEALLDFGDGDFAGIDGDGGSHIAGQVQAEGVEVGDGDVAGAGVADDGDGHEADGACAGDEHVFAEDGEGEGGVDGVAEGVEDGGDVFGDALVVTPDVGHGEGDVFGKGAGAIDANAGGIGAEMAAAGEAVPAASAGDVAFAAKRGRRRGSRRRWRRRRRFCRRTHGR